MALAISHEDTQILLKDKNVLQDSVLNKYRTAGQVAQTALKYVSSLINDSYHSKTAQRQLTVSELCLLTDSFILTRLEQYYKNKVNERGIAVPTTIDIDQISGGWCPEIDDTQNLLNWNKDKDSTFESAVTGILKAGDLVKITLGVHIDGYTSEVSHTMVIYPVDETKPTAQPTGPLLGGKADAVAAAHIAMETVVALLACALTPEKLPASLGGALKGVTGQSIRTVVDTIARSYNCAVVPGSRVRRIRRFLAGQNEGIVAEREYKGVIWTESHQEAELLSTTDAKDLTVIDRGQSTPFTNASAIPSDDFVVQSGEVYLVDLKMASLENCSKNGLITLETVDSYTGKSHKAGELIARPGVFVRDFAQSHILKLKTSRKLLTNIDRQGVYPFKLSHLSSNFPFVDESEEELQNLKKDLRSFRLGMSEISNNYLCVESPIQIARWIPWDHILKATNSNGNLSYDASTTLTLPGHELPLPKLGVSAIKLKALLNSTKESPFLPVARECNTVVLCDATVSTTDRPELLRLTGGSKTCQPSWIHSQRELNPENSIVQGIFQLATLAKDKRFGLSLKETQPMKRKNTVTLNGEVEETMKE